MSRLKDIAEETGLAIGTVSRILRGRQRVAEDTRKQVFEVAERLKYRPNLLIKGVQTGRTQTIGVEMRLGADGFRAMILRGITDELLKVDYVPIVVSGTSEGPPYPLDLIHALVDRRVDGIILYPNDDTEPDDYLREVWDRDIPLTTVDREMVHTHADFVGTDDIAGGRIAAEYLLGLGHRRLAHLAAPQVVRTAKDRNTGFAQAVKEVADASLTTLEEKDWHANAESALQLLARQDRPTAIFCDSDMMALGVYAVARQTSLVIPYDLSVVGYADIQAAMGLYPALTTIRQAPYEIGRLAAQQVLNRINGSCSSKTPRKLRLAPELVVRESTSAPAAV